MATERDDHGGMMYRLGKSMQFCAVLAASALMIGSSKVHAQPLSCALGKVKEHAAPMYPIQLQGRIVEGVVLLDATFAPDGRVNSSKVLSGPQALRFAAESYVRGWRAEPNDAQRQCAITVEFRFDGSQAACNAHTEVHARAERLDDNHVLIHLDCDLW